MSDLARLHVCIGGLGLMGASLALALEGRCAELAGFDANPEAVEQALARGIVARASTGPGPALAGADLVVLALPVRAILELLPALPAYVGRAFHVLDLGSTKAAIIAEMERLPAEVSPLGGHPMCGRETSGLAAATASLYRDCLFVLTPLARTSPATLSLGHELAGAVAARPLVLDAERHDRLVAAISHVPYLTSAALVAGAAGCDDPLAWALAASGFRDSTRLAGSDVTMMVDILLTNRAHVLAALARVELAAGELGTLLAAGDEAGLRARLEALREARAAAQL